jgi:hypothetical protein
MKINRIAVVVTVIGMSFSTAAFAAGHDDQQIVTAAAESRTITLTSSSNYQPQLTRPALLPALYVTLGGMQAWDLFSTSAAVKAGAREANPSAAPFANNTGSLLGLKLATTASTIFFAERAWKHNRVAAVVMMAAINGATAVVAMQNVRNASRR